MAQLGTVVLTGRSGRPYAFRIFPRHEPFRASGAVYVVARQAAADGVLGSVLAELVGPRAAAPGLPPELHSIVYVGETADLSTGLLDHAAAACFDTHGADCVCIHDEGDAETRASMAADLRARFDPPCNQI